MLPLLPALILLLLQGPAGIERMAANGQLPGALHALHRQMAKAQEKTCVRDDVVLASLLAAGQDKSMSRALLQLLTSVDALFAEPIPAKPEPSRDIVSPPLVATCLGTPQEGFFDCRRSRDGPWIA